MEAQTQSKTQQGHRECGIAGVWPWVHWLLVPLFIPPPGCEESAALFVSLGREDSCDSPGSRLTVVRGCETTGYTWQAPGEEVSAQQPDLPIKGQ